MQQHYDGAQRADQEVQQVEDLLRGPAVLGAAARDAQQLHQRHSG